MKKIVLSFTFALAAMLFSGCEVVLVAPGIQPGTPVTINNDAGVTETINPSAAGRYELVVGDQPVRIDVYQEAYSPDGDLIVSVNDKDNFTYALTYSRLFFEKPTAVASIASTQDIGVNPPYSINIPAHFGKAYIMVKNQTQVSQTVTVKAFTRNTVERSNFAINAPSGGAAAVSYRGAILFLDQTDTYVFHGSSELHTLDFGVPGDNYLHLKLHITGTDTYLNPGDTAVLADGDSLEIYSEDGFFAGFCESLDGCNDGLDTGEYFITISDGVG